MHEIFFKKDSRRKYTKTVKLWLVLLLSIFCIKKKLTRAGIVIAEKSLVSKSVWICFLKFLKIFKFLAVPSGLWDLSSLTRDRTQAHGTESVES